VAKKRDLELLPVHRTRGDRPIAPKPRQHSGADGVRRARVGRSDDAQGDHVQASSPGTNSEVNSSSGMPYALDSDLHRAGVGEHLPFSQSATSD
jgi:hypothetical protein